MTETVAEILDAYRGGTPSPRISSRAASRASAPTTIRRFSSRCAKRPTCSPRRARSRAPADETLPLYGIPVAVKDNIDVKGLPTTAACPAYLYRPHKDATCGGAPARGRRDYYRQDQSRSVRHRPGRRAHALRHRPQSVQSRSSFPADRAPGSALAVGAGLVPLALGTDTAGSGRVPAGFNNVVGLKPSRRMVSNAGVVPACRTLDCVSVLALTVDDA